MSRRASAMLLALPGRFLLELEIGAMTVPCGGDSITCGKSSPTDGVGGYRGNFPTLQTRAGKTATLAPVNQAVPAIDAQRAARELCVEWSDVRAALTTSATGPDTVRPKAPGYAKIAPSWPASIERGPAVT